MRKLLVLALAFFSCADLGRNNPYDPDSKNYDSSLTGENNISSSTGSDNSSSSSSLASSSSSSVDDSTVTIGTQTWQKYNSNIETNLGQSKCYNEDPENCKKYGRLYDWTAAQHACPEGFHLPSKQEWLDLTEYVENEKCPSEKKCAGTHLKSENGWDYDNVLNQSGNGKDTYGFSALPAGSANNIGKYGVWWSATESNSQASYLQATNDNSVIECHDEGTKSSYRSVRCLKDQN